MGAIRPSEALVTTDNSARHHSPHDLINIVVTTPYLVGLIISKQARKIVLQYTDLQFHLYAAAYTKLQDFKSENINLETLK
jgi:hypothetical protein